METGGGRHRCLHLPCKSEHMSSLQKCAYTPKPGRLLSRVFIKHARLVGTALHTTKIKIEKNRNSQPVVSLQSQPYFGNRVSCGCITILLLTVLVAVVVILSFQYKVFFFNRCTNKVIINATVLKDNLTAAVFGQPGVIDAVTKELADSSATLHTLLFIGSSGIGKTWTTLVLGEALESNVRLQRYTGDLHFKNEMSAEALASSITSKSNCILLNVIIFDDIDNYLKDVELVIYYASNKFLTLKIFRVIFIIVSNLGSEQTVEIAANFTMQGETRLKISKIISEKVKVEMFRDAIIVPFLPLRLEEVEQCVVSASKPLGIEINETSKAVLVRSSKLFPHLAPLFVVDGCKHVATNLYVHKDVRK